MLGGPAEAGPARRRPAPAPSAGGLEAEGLVARAAAAAELGELAHQVVGQETADLRAERRVLGAVSQVHRPGSVAEPPPPT